MRKLKFTMLFIIGFTLFACQSKFDLKQDKHLAEVFADGELAEIQKMISYVDDRVMELTNNKDINKAPSFLYRLMKKKNMSFCKV